MGKKYIIELEDGESVYKTITYNGYPMIQDVVPAPYAEPDLEQIRKEAYEKGWSDAEEGKATCQYCEYQYLDDTEEPCKKCCNAYMNKYKPKAKEEQIQVGDEVTPIETEYDDMIVTRLWKDDYDSDCIDAIGFDGRIGSFLVSRVSKTGKHYEIAEVFEKMRGEQDG